MGNSIKKSRLDSFQALFKEPDTTKDFLTYYVKLVTWVKENIDVFDRQILKNNRLDVLLTLDPVDYIVDQVELSLTMEGDRIGKQDFKTINDLAMAIGDTLWDMVTICSDRDCPNCIDDGLRYTISELLTTEKSVITLECDTCGWTENIDGTKWDGGMAKVRPANKYDLLEKGKNLCRLET